MRKLTILVDMDDTIENLCEEWINVLNEKYGTKVILQDITEWDMTKFFPTLSREQIYAPLFDEAFWRRVRPLPGAAKYLQKLKNEGHDILIVTSSHQDTVALKLNNVLFKYLPFLDYKDVIITSRKQLVMGDVLVDDYPYNLEGGLYMPILMNAPHNQEYEAEENGMIRVSNWDEIYEVIQQIANEEIVDSYSDYTKAWAQAYAKGSVKHQ